MIKKRKKSTNKKVRNATPTEVDGIKFQSKLEAFTYRKLKENNIVCEYEPTSYTLIDKFEYNGEKVRAITYTPDFVSEDFIIEVKGLQTDVFKMRYKLFKRYLKSINSKIDLYLPRNQKDVLSVIEEIKIKALQKILLESLKQNV